MLNRPTRLLKMDIRIIIKKEITIEIYFKIIKIVIFLKSICFAKEATVHQNTLMNLIASFAVYKLTYFIFATIQS